MIKFLLILTLFITSLYSKECFKDKSSNKIVCYYKYFDRAKIHNAKQNETYYITKNESIYAFSDKVEVSFYAIGAILSVLDDFEIDFYDKTKAETYIFKVYNPNELFSIVSNLNRLDSVKRALPLRKRKYTKAQIDRKIAARKARQQAAIAKMKAKEAAKEARKANKHKMGSFKGNFLNPEK